MLYVLRINLLHHLQILITLTFGSVVDTGPVQTQYRTLLAETQIVLRGN